MTAKPVDYRDLGFADSELRFYRVVGDKLVVSVLLWNGRLATLRFQGVGRVLSHVSSDISAFIEREPTSPFLIDALSDIYEKVPASHPYRHFQFLGVDDQEVLGIVAESLEVSVRLPAQ